MTNDNVGDGLRPICQNCLRGHRSCSRLDGGLKFVIHTPFPELYQRALFGQPAVITSPGGQSQSTTEISGTRHINSSSSNPELPPDHLVSSEPRLALNNHVVAAAFRHYVDNLAPWYDLNDMNNSFARIVPLRALNNPLLFKALTAFSAYHKSRLSGEMQGFGVAFHDACVQDLLQVVNHLQMVQKDDYLAATCLLRSYVILTGMAPEVNHNDVSLPMLKNFR